MQFSHTVHFTTAEATIAEVKQHIDQYKVIHVAGVPDLVSIHEFYADLSDACGKVFPLADTKSDGRLTGERWLVNLYDPAEPERFRSSNTWQPLHTDSSCLEHLKDNISFFYCLGQAKLGGASYFLDLDTMIEAMELDGEQQLIQELMTVPVTFSKGEMARTRPILSKDDIGWSINYNYYCTDPNNTPEAKALVLRFHQYLEARIHNAGIYLNILLKKGEAVLFHDQRILHGRYAFQTPNKGDRILYKGVFLLPSRSHIIDI